MISKSGSRSINTWHYGLVARWWHEFNHEWEVEDINYFLRMLAHGEGPVLDVGCGTGRLTVPLAESGLDIEGTDVSADMLYWAEEKASTKKLRIKFHEQSTHKLVLPRNYQTIIMCGVFGVGGDRGTDLEGLRRIKSHLAPGGKFIMDHHASDSESQRSLASRRLPQSWPQRGERKRAADGTEIEIKVRSVSFDVSSRCETRQIMAVLYEGNAEIQRQITPLTICHYSWEDVEQLLGVAGFENVVATAGLTDSLARANDRRIMFHAS